MSVTPDAVDAELRALIAQGDIARATDQAIRRYGPELVGWLCASMREADALDAFSITCERLWKSLPTYQGRCSVRVWCYMLARQAAAAVHARPERRHEELVSQVSSVAQAVWYTTRREQARTDALYAELRRNLSEEDRTLLVLRVDRDMPWRDIALVLLGDASEDDAVTRKAAALRKQFERVKAELRAAAAGRLAE